MGNMGCTAIFTSRNSPARLDEPGPPLSHMIHLKKETVSKFTIETLLATDGSCDRVDVKDPIYLSKA